MDDLIDDDFGDLYADVEVQASSAINSMDISVERSRADGDVDNDIEEPKDENRLLDSEHLDSIREKSGNYSDSDRSDSEDDLNIVVNDDDCQRFSVAAGRNGHVSGFEEAEEEAAMAEEEGNETGGGSAFLGGRNGPEKNGSDPNDPNGYYLQYPRNKIVRHHGSSIPNVINGGDSVFAASCYCRSAGGDMLDNSRRKLKVSNLGLVSSIAVTANSAASHGRYGFSLPWYRTILDVDIDAFEDKGWRYPGVDLTDFFNFGFDEDSWRQYCISLKQFRQQSSYINSSIPTRVSSKLVQANGIGSEHERSTQDAEADNITQVGLSSKSADSGEGLLDLPKGRAIQVEDGTRERQPTMDIRRPRCWDSDVVIEINVLDSVENGSGCVKDELGHTECSELGASKRRDTTMDDSSCSVKDELGHLETSRLDISKGRDITADDLKHACYSEHASGDEVSIQSVEGNISCSQPVPKSNQVHLDSAKVGDENDEDQNCHQKVHAKAVDNVSGAMDTVEKAEEKFVGNMCKSDPSLVEPELAHGDRFHFSPSLSYSGSYSEASIDSVYGSPFKSPSPLRRPSSGMELQESFASYHRSPENICIRRMQGRRHYQRNKATVGEGEKHQRGRHHRTAKWRINQHDGKVSTIPRDKSPVSCDRQIGRMHNYHKRENFSYSDQRDQFCGYRDHSRRNDHWSFIDGIKLASRREWSEGYLHKRSFRDDIQDNVDRGWHRGGRDLPPEDMVPYSYKEFRQLVSVSHSYKERDMQWKRKTNFDNSLCDHGYRKDITIQERYRRSNSFANRRTDFMDERGEQQSLEVKPSGRRLRCDDGFPVNLENSWCVELEEEYRNFDRQHLPARYCRGSHIADEGRWQNGTPPMNEMFESRSTKRNGRYIRQIYHEDCRGNGYVHSYSDDSSAEAGMMHLNEVHFGRKCSLQSRGTHPNDDIHAKRVSYSHGKRSRYKRALAKYRSIAGGISINGLQMEHQYNMIGEESNTNSIHNSKMIDGSDHKQVRRCSDPKDLVVGEGKSCGRSINDRSFVRNGKLELKDLKSVEEQRVLKIFNESRGVLETESTKFEGNRDDKTWVSFTEHNEDLDIEEGQIVTEEPNKKDSLELENVAPMHNEKGRNFCGEYASIRSTHKRVYDNDKILETLAKMEKRKERFKDPIALKKESDKFVKPEADLTVVTGVAKQDRPARKRRWGGS